MSGHQRWLEGPYDSLYEQERAADQAIDDMVGTGYVPCHNCDDLPCPDCVDRWIEWHRD